MKNLTFIIVLIATLALYSTGCKKSDENNTNETVLTNNYKGQLHLLFSNSYPEFNENTSIDVNVDKNGKMTFGIGGLTYFGEDNNGQSKIRRDGELIIAPNGNYFMNNDKVNFSVDENTMITETMKVWYWDGSNWKLSLNETITDTWNGGLSFSLIEAETSGSVVAVTTANGTVKWTFTLTPIP